MATEPANLKRVLDCTNTGSVWAEPVPVDGYDYATVQIATATGSAAFGTTVVALRRSNDGKNNVPLETPQSLTTDGAQSAHFDVSTTRYINLVTTTATSAVRLDCSIHLSPRNG